MLSSEILDNITIQHLPELREKLKEAGEIKFAYVFHDTALSDKQFQQLTEIGFQSKQIPNNLDLHYLLDVYDLALSKQADLFILGTTREDLIPLFIEMRKNYRVYALINQEVSKAFVESVDTIINHDKIEEFSLLSTHITEVENYLNYQNGNGEIHELGDIQHMDDTNIGITSDDLDEIIIDNGKMDDKEEKIRENVEVN